MTDILKNLFTDADTNRLHDELVPVRELSYDMEKEAINGTPLTTYSRSQFLARLNVPVRFYDHMRSHKDGIGLMGDTINHLMSRSRGELLVRQDHTGQAAAVLSSQYARLDNADLIEALQRTGINGIQARVTRAAHAFRVHIDIRKFTVPFNDGKPDTMFLGLTLENSEVGYRSASIRVGLYRLICLNGMTIPTMVFGKRVFHAGGEADTDGIRRVEPERIAALMERLADPSGAERLWDRAQGQIEHAINQPVQHPEFVARLLRKELRVGRADLTPSEAEYIAQQRPETAWDVVNAITEQAHSASEDRVPLLHDAGGQALTLSPRQWERINDQAAELAAAA